MELDQPRVSSRVLLSIQPGTLGSKIPATSLAGGEKKNREPTTCKDVLCPIGSGFVQDTAIKHIVWAAIQSL